MYHEDIQRPRRYVNILSGIDQKRIRHGETIPEQEVVIPPQLTYLSQEVFWSLSDIGLEVGIPVYAIGC